MSRASSCFLFVQVLDIQCITLISILYCARFKLSILRRLLQVGTDCRPVCQYHAPCHTLGIIPWWSSDRPRLLRSLPPSLTAFVFCHLFLGFYDYHSCSIPSNIDRCSYPQTCSSHMLLATSTPLCTENRTPHELFFPKRCSSTGWNIGRLCPTFNPKAPTIVLRNMSRGKMAWSHVTGSQQWNLVHNQQSPVRLSPGDLPGRTQPCDKLYLCFIRIIEFVSCPDSKPPATYPR